MRRRRRRTVVLVPLALIAAAVVAVLVVTGGHGSSKAGGHASKRAHRSSPAQHAKPAPPRIVKGPHNRPVPILMYHVISPPQPGAPYPELYTPQKIFAAQMQALARRGYHGVTLRQVDQYWHRGHALPSRPVVVSFDDGYLSHYTHARPVL